jgi:signal transduction histidine kinase
VIRPGVLLQEYVARTMTGRARGSTVASVRAQRVPPLPDVAIAAIVAVTLLACAIGRGETGVGSLVCAVALAVPLAWRSIVPLTVLAVVTALVFVSMGLFEGSMLDLLPAAIGLFSVALFCDTTVALCAAIAAVPLAVLGVALFSHESAWRVETLKTLGIIVLPLVCGSMMREKKAKACALRERAERAEAALEEEALRRVSEERLRIAREVHDVVAHAMVAINVQAGVAAHVVDRKPEQALTALEEIKRVSGDALRDLRETLGVLREPDVPAPTEPTRTLENVGELADSARAAGLDVDLEREDCDRVPAAVAAVAYRIVQEALTNVLRHAPDATRAAVHLIVRDDALEVEVADDGTGLGPGADGSGNGLRGMRERAAAVGGSVEAGPARERGGWTVRAFLPLPISVAT